MIKKTLQWLGWGNNAHEHETTLVVPAKNLEFEQDAAMKLYDFNEVPAAEMKNYPDAIYDLYTGKTDGFLIKNFISPEAVDKLLASLDTIRRNDEQLAHTPVGFTYPMVFAEYNRQIGNLPELEKQQATEQYYLNMERFNKTFAAEYGFDAHKLITDFMLSVGGGRNVEQPEGSGDIGRFPFATYRYLVPEQGLMSIHCANYFGTTFSNAYAHLNRKVKAKDQMSYFIMLQEAEEGGELSLFNFRWEPGQTKETPHEDDEIIQPDGSKINVKTDPSIKKNRVKPQKGDLILFQGGNIWHKVETVRGNIPRITFGGFLALSHDEKTIYYWS